MAASRVQDHQLPAHGVHHAQLRIHQAVHEAELDEDDQHGHRDAGHRGEAAPFFAQREAVAEGRVHTKSVAGSARATRTRGSAPETTISAHSAKPVPRRPRSSGMTSVLTRAMWLKAGT